MQEYGGSPDQIHGQHGIGIVMIPAKVSLEQRFGTSRPVFVLRIEGDSGWHVRGQDGGLRFVAEGGLVLEGYRRRGEEGLPNGFLLRGRLGELRIRGWSVEVRHSSDRFYNDVSRSERSHKRTMKTNRSLPGEGFLDDDMEDDMALGPVGKGIVGRARDRGLVVL